MTNLTLNPTGTAASLTNQIRDIKGPVEIANPWMWVWWGLAVLAVAGLLYWAWRWSQRKAQAPTEPPIPAHIRARQRLQQALRLVPEPREFCISVSDTLRWYLEERFALRAPERTTEEFLQELQSSNVLSSQQKLSLADFLERCDLVKFAKFEPREPELLQLHDSALRLVDETAPYATAAPPAAGTTDSVNPPARA